MYIINTNHLHIQCCRASTGSMCGENALEALQQPGGSCGSGAAGGPTDALHTDWTQPAAPQSCGAVVKDIHSIARQCRPLQHQPSAAARTTGLTGQDKTHTFKNLKQAQVWRWKRGDSLRATSIKSTMLTLWVCR